MAVTDIGKVAYLNKGAYSSETNYEINDVVTYEGSSYVSKGNNNQGNLPTNTTYWDLVAQKGIDGQPGQDGYTPVKGVDYFTTSEIQGIENDIKSGLAAVATSGSYNDLSNKPTIPDVSNFITKDVDNLTYYYTKTEVDSKVSSVYKYKGSVNNYSDLPSTDLTIGDVYNIVNADSTHGIKTGDNVAWNGTIWDVLGGDVDLSGYQTKIDSTHKLSSDLVDDTGQTNKFFSGNYNDLINKPVINDEIYYETTGQNTNNPFIFDGCKKGIHYFNFPYDKGTLYYKTTSTDTVKTYSGQISYMQFFKDVDFNTLEEDEEFGYVVVVNSGNSQSTNGSLNKQSIKKASTPFYGSTINLYKIITSKNQSFSGVKIFQSIPKQNDTTAPTQDAEFTNKKYVDDSVAKASTMPTASNDYLGKIYQYIGTTDSTYTKGHFYECVSDGGNTPTYSWNEIAFGGVSYMPIYTLKDTEYYDYASNTFSSNFKTYFIPILNDMISRDVKNAIMFAKLSGNNSQFAMNKIWINNDTNAYMGIMIEPFNQVVKYLTLDAQFYGNAKITMTKSDGVVTDISTTWNLSNTKFLPTNNTKTFNPTAGSYQPATAKYVDDKPTTYTGYDATKTQTLKNVNGTLTWVDD